VLRSGATESISFFKVRETSASKLGMIALVINRRRAMIRNFLYFTEYFFMRNGIGDKVCTELLASRQLILDGTDRGQPVRGQGPVRLDQIGRTMMMSEIVIHASSRNVLTFSQTYEDRPARTLTPRRKKND
jgi:hypothetical protein